MIRSLFNKKKINNLFTKKHVYDKRIYKDNTCVKCKQLLENIYIEIINDDLVKVKCPICNEEMIFKNWEEGINV